MEAVDTNNLELGSTHNDQPRDTSIMPNIFSGFMKKHKYPIIAITMLTILCITGFTLIAVFSTERSKEPLASTTGAPSYPDVKPCHLPFFCDSRYLYAIGNSGAFVDSKSIVDLTMKRPFDEFQAEFDMKLFRPEVLSNSTAALELILEYFNFPGIDLADTDPDDWIAHPFNETMVSDTNLLKWALDLNEIFKDLSKRAALNHSNVGQSTFLAMKRPTIVPGGRFQEAYYWDSYWTMKGLLVCEMKNTVKAMLENFVDHIKTFGFIPNGGREYYRTRSQPPFFSLMVQDYVNSSNDQKFIEDNIAYLDKEFQFWMQNRQVEVNGYVMHQYRTNMTHERPESFREDNETARKAVELMGRSKEQVFVDLSSAAESGWDFSSRWLAYSGEHSSKLYSIRTTRVVPVCLNSILCKVARTLMDFHKNLNNSDMAKMYEYNMDHLRDGIHDMMWNQEFAQYFDYDIDTKAGIHQPNGASFFPIWAQCHKLNQSQLNHVITRLRNSGYLDFVGGYPTSKIYTEQQWDFPNAWAPLQHVLLESLENMGADDLALSMAQKWIINNYQTYMKTNFSMFEKYSAVRIGYPGLGGEYDVQKGFGWTNGVALDLLKKYGKLLNATDQ